MFKNPNTTKIINFIEAIENNKINIIKTLLKDLSFLPNFDDNQAFQLSARLGHIEIVELLLNDKRIDPAVVTIPQILGSPCTINSNKTNYNIVELLLKNKIIDPSIDYNYAIIYSSKFGHEQIVDLLLKDKRVDPSDHRNCSIRHSYEHKHKKITQLLWKDQRVKNTLMKDDLELYNKLIKNEVLEKISVF